MLQEFVSTISIHEISSSDYLMVATLAVCFAIGVGMALFSGDYSVLAHLATWSVFMIAVFALWHQLYRHDLVGEVPSFQGVYAVLFATGAVLNLVSDLRAFYRLTFHHGESEEE